MKQKNGKIVIALQLLRTIFCNALQQFMLEGCFVLCDRGRSVYDVVR